MIFYAASDVGKKREKNEDYYDIKTICDNVYLYVIADGLGGYQSGEVASKLAVDTIIAYFQNKYEINKKNNVKNILKQAIILANEKIYNLEKTDNKYKGMATTIVVLCIVKDKMYYVSIGDSRMYNINEQMTEITQITEDDTYVNALLKTNIINEMEALNHPQKHMLTKAVGIFNEIDFDIYELKENIDGYFLICTDGVTNMLDENELLNIFKRNKFENVAEKIIQKANDKGGIDNSTAIVIKKER